MTADGGAPTPPPSVVRQLDSSSALTLVDLSARFEDLQTVLRCCEQLVSMLALDDTEEIVVESVWTTALLSYTRCFSPGESEAALSEADLAATLDNDEVLNWHKVLVQLRDHYADPSTNPRERFSVGVAQDEASGAASGVAITSARQPLVDDLTVRQTGAIAFALSGLVNDRIISQQEKIFGEVKDASKADLDRLARLELAQPE